MSVTLPPRPRDLDDPNRVDQDALIKEARRRARRRRQRNLVGVLAGMLGALWLYSLLGGSGPESGSAFLSESVSQSAALPKDALPEELSFNVKGGIVLLRRDGRQRILARGVTRRLSNGNWLIRVSSALAWSPDGSKLLAC
jgi:hypothetical protein